jgi:hypothetical protein
MLRDRRLLSSDDRKVRAARLRHAVDDDAQRLVGVRRDRLVPK